MADIRQLTLHRDDLLRRAARILSFQINRNNLPGECYSDDAEEIVEFIMMAVECSIGIAELKKEIK